MSETSTSRPALATEAAADPTAGTERDSRMAAAQARLLEAAASDERFAGFEVIEIVVARPGRVVARGRLAEQEVYLKLLPEAEGTGMVRAARAEHDRMSGIMGEGRLRIARLVASDPERRLIATEAVRGRRLDRAVNGAAPAERRRLYGLAGAWLARYAGPSRRTVPFDPGSFLGGVRGLVLEASGSSSLVATAPRTRHWVSAALPGEDRERMHALRSWMVRAATEAAGTPMSIAATHDDFTPTNLVVTWAGGLVGYDIGGWFLCPVADASARLLTVGQGRDKVADGAWMGLDSVHVDGFLGSGVLAADEARRLLPLHVAQKLDLMLSRHAARPPALERLRPVIDAFLRRPEAI